MQLDVPDDAIAVLRPLFTEVEGSCEVWSDEEVVRRMLVRGAMAYARSAGRDWDGQQAVAEQLRRAFA